MKQIRLLSALALMLGLVITACKKDQLLLGFEDSEQMVASTDQTTSEDLYSDVEDQVDMAIETRGLGQDCPEVTVEPADGSYPRTITIDFGDGCEGPNGRIRKGQIVVNLSDTLSNPGATRTVTFVDFYIDDAHIEGTKTFTNLGPNAEGNVTFQRTIDGQITFPNGEVATWHADHLITQIEGNNTPTSLDNVYEITGNSNGVNRHGKTFSTEIIEPVIRKKSCPWRVAGVVSLTVENKTVTIDYGDGTCDQIATLTDPNGNQHTILIKKWWN